MNPLNLNKTNTTRFMLAMIFNDDVKYDEILKDVYTDSYTSDYYTPENDGYILVVRSINEAPRDTINPPIRTYQRDTHFIFVYEVPDKFKQDYAYLLLGKFEMLSYDYRNKMLDFWDEINDDDMDLVSLLFVNEESLTKIYRYNKFEEMYKVRKQEDF